MPSTICFSTTKGSTTPATSGRPSAVSTRAVICSLCWSVKGDPSTVVKTTVPEAPAKSGSSSASLSATSPEAVPGMSKTRTQGPRSNKEAGYRDTEENQPRRDHRPGAPCRELPKAIQQFSQDYSPLK